MGMDQDRKETPLAVIANVSRIVTKVVDRITGDRVDYPLLVAAACAEALRQHGIGNTIMYGKAAWIEVLENNTPVWSGCWDGNFGFWVATEHGEVVDLNTSVAFRKRARSHPTLKAIYSAPLLWSAEVPRFYRYQPEGIAEVDLADENDRRRHELALAEIREKCGPAQIEGKEPEFPNEAILCPGRRLLDDSEGTFRKLDRILGIRGIPQFPF